jgi:hypothetical protein
MSHPKLHHYVPQFYLRRFADSAGRLWVWDREAGRVFCARPGSVAAESNFYFLSELAEQGHDPLTMERQFADLEGEVSAITGQWLDWIRQGELGDSVAVPDVNRELVSLFLALQFLRPADTRSILAAFSKSLGHDVDSDAERRALHADLLWNDELMSSFADRVGRCTWLFGRNSTSTPFTTSDNPVARQPTAERQRAGDGGARPASRVRQPGDTSSIIRCHRSGPGLSRRSRSAGLI